MKKKLWIFMLPLAVLTASCEQYGQNQPLEYKVVRMSGEALRMNEDYLPANFADPTSMLNSNAKEGWTLDQVYTEVMTDYPNLARDKYHVTGVRSNTKTRYVYFIFKRRRREGAKEEQMETTNAYSIPLKFNGE